MVRSKIDLRSPIFHDDEVAREHLEAMLWPKGPVCPRCGVTGDRITKMAGKARGPASTTARTAASRFPSRSERSWSARTSAF